MSGRHIKLFKEKFKIVQMVLITCISSSRGQKIGFQIATFKNLLV